MQKTKDQRNVSHSAWIPLSDSVSFLFSRKALLGWSVLLVLLTFILTWLGFLLTTGLMDSLTGSFFTDDPSRESLWGLLKFGGWFAAKYLFLFISRIIAFFLAFLIAFTLTTPLYGFLSAATERSWYGADFQDDEGFTWLGIVKDLLEGFKVALFGVFITIIALLLNFIPLFGQIVVFLIYTYYSTLMFIDYPASRRRWGLGQKLSWLRRYHVPSLRLGFLPAVIGMIPILNMLFMAIFFPLFTIHTTLNFANIQAAQPHRATRVEP